MQQQYIYSTCVFHAGSLTLDYILQNRQWRGWCSSRHC